MQRKAHADAASLKQRTVGCRVDHRLGDRLDEAVVRLRRQRPQERHSAASLLHAALEHYLDHLDDLPVEGPALEHMPLERMPLERGEAREPAASLGGVPFEEASTT